jgi:hypothetical protein
MNAIASCGENGGVPPGGGFVVSALIDSPAGSRIGEYSFSLR